MTVNGSSAWNNKYLEGNHECGRDVRQKFKDVAQILLQLHRIRHSNIDYGEKLAMAIE